MESSNEQVQDNSGVSGLGETDEQAIERAVNVTNSTTRKRGTLYSVYTDEQRFLLSFFIPTRNESTDRTFKSKYKSVLATRSLSTTATEKNLIKKTRGRPKLLGSSDDLVKATRQKMAL